MHTLTIKPAAFAWLAAASLTAAPAFAQDATPPPPLAPTPSVSVPPAPPAPPSPPAPPAPPMHHGRPPHDGPPPGEERGRKHEHEHGDVPGEEDERPDRPGDEHRRGGPREEGMPMDRHHGEDMMPMERHHEEMIRLERRQREPVTFLGVAVAPVPPALADQLNLPEGFGLLASYIVPGSPAEKAGLKTNDVLKSLNDQTLVSPDQLATLVRSFKEGQDVSLTLLRKGHETKLGVKLEKQVPPPMGGGPEMEDRRVRRMPFNFNGPRDREEDDENDMDSDEGPGPRSPGRRDSAGQPPPPPAPPVREILRELRPEVREIAREARQNAEQLRKEITILRERGGASRTTRLDLGQARIVVKDDTGELSLKVDDGKRTLVAKDPDGKVLFNGPVTTEDERKAVPSDVRARLEKLEHEQMPDVPQPPAAPKGD